MKIENAGLGYTFTLPDRLTTDELDTYQLGINKAITDLKGALTDMRYFAIIFGTAVQSAWVKDWQCEAMPSITGSVGSLDAKVIISVGKQIRDFVKGYTDISPN